ncbi:MAG: TonB-dependent receptor [Gammaproteobacteria bacterium]|nr:TonB-dependent receptor [Gammaproteobacteria bacterium]
MLGEIKVTATRVEKSLFKVPAAMGVINQDDIQLGRQQLGLDEFLVNIPGLFLQDRHNFAQDLRISIRGFGARSNFGIRGIKIYSDGLPLTLPDGQGNVDEIDLGSTRRLEVIRGPASSLYGASSGGVINIFTEDGPDTPFVQGRFNYGSYDFQNYQIKTGGQYDQINYLFNISRLNLDGFRDHSKVESNGINGKFRYDLDPTSNLTLVVNAVNQPISDDPGGLIAGEVAGTTTLAACRAAGFKVNDGRKAAACRNVAYDAGESVDQQKFGLIYRKHFGEKHEILLRNYYLWRDFQNKLPAGGGGLLGNSVENSAWVEFGRFFLGGGGQYIYTDSFLGHRNRFTVGFDIDAQEDDRQRYNNVLGAQGALRFDQIEQVESRGVYAQNEFSLLDNLELTVGARYDVIDYEVEDHFLTDVTGDDSDSVDFDHVSPMVGLLWSPIEEINLYGNVSTAFETPTTTEFANPVASGTAGGLNTSLKPQTATNYEIGVKGLIPAVPLHYDFAVFHIDTEDEFVPLTVAGAPLGRSFLENAEETTRDGYEALVSWQPIPGLTVTGSYTYSDFEFEQFTSTAGTVFSGNKIPGIPENQFHGEISYYHPSGWYGIWDMLHVDSLYVDNANILANQNPDYHVANLRLGYVREYGNFEISPFLGINNMFNEEYNGNVRINAVGGRFFEPAPPRNVYGGISVRFNFN